ncbi:hypothetical protein J0S82_001609 [Galemys pyrenaicus]|uniref:Uncharacterized protein n=1 Tax=Galemys pyrenaicus TaxID=202257 RepID=A0A8J5ZWQ5_GALPY|nr:hypothetical protein J0S82_001609 [Galemys pyrenaicus]
MPKQGCHSMDAGWLQLKVQVGMRELDHAIGINSYSQETLRRPAPFLQAQGYMNQVWPLLTCQSPQSLAQWGPLLPSWAKADKIRWLIDQKLSPGL